MAKALKIKGVKQRITAKQKAARRKNIAIARKYRGKRSGKVLSPAAYKRNQTMQKKRAKLKYPNKRRRSTKSIKKIGWSGGNKPASGKGLKGVARYKRIAERSLYRIMQIQKNRPMSKLTKADQKKVRVLSKTMTRFTMKYTRWRPERSVSSLRM